MLLIEKKFEKYVKEVEKQNNVTITNVNGVSVEGKRKSGQEFSVIIGFSQDMTNFDTYGYTDKPFTKEELERFRNLVLIYLKMELEKCLVK